MLKTIFNNFANNECIGVSPLYYQLSLQVAEEEKLLVVAAYTAQRQPPPNLFFGAVHYLLLKDHDAELAQYYPSISAQSIDKIPFLLFKKYCLENVDLIIELLKSRIVQTNALNRSAYLMPIIYSLFKKGDAINLVDIGTSAGLSLNFDHYTYDYGDGICFGNSKVSVRSEIKEGQLPSFEQGIRIHKKTGIDQNPLDIKIKDNALWLKALIWPDMTERFIRMEHAIEVAQDSTMELIKTQSIKDFKMIILKQDLSVPLVVYHTHVLCQFTLKERQQFWQMLDEVSQTRDFFYLAAEGSGALFNNYGKTGVLVELTQYKKGEKMSQLLAETNSHANWIKWQS